MKKGRPKKENAKRRQLRLRMTEEDFQLIDIASKECGCTKTHFMMEAMYFLMRNLDPESQALISEKLYDRLKTEER